MLLHTLYCNLLHVCKEKVVFYAVAERYGDNMRYIAEKLLHSSECKVVWVSEKQRVNTPQGIKSVKGRYALCKELATAHVIVTDGRLSKFWGKGFVKKPGQIVIESRYVSGIAKSGVDAHDVDAPMLEKITKDSRLLDILVSDSRWSTERYRCNYRFGGVIMEVGTPRNEVLLPINRSRIQGKVQGFYHISPRHKIALYTPASRPWKGTHFPQMDYNAVLSALSIRFGGEWKLLIRRSPQHTCQPVPMGNSSIVDVWDYPDTAELLATADVLIGDYDDCSFDFLLTGRPVFLYIPDVEEYDKQVGFYNRPETTPVPAARDNNSLISEIKKFDIDSYAQHISAFLCERGVVRDAQATMRICDIIEKKVRDKLPSLTPFREEIIADMKRRVRDMFYHSVDLDLDRRRHYVLGLRFMTLRNPHPPNNPYANLPIEEDKIFIWPVLPGYSCNPKYIVEELLRRNLPYKIVWCTPPNDKISFKKLEIFPSKLRVVILKTDEAWRELATAKILLCTGHRVGLTRAGYPKRKEQIYIQLWHGNFGIKDNPLDPIRRIWSVLSERQIDWLIAGSKYQANVIYPPMFCLTKAQMSRILLYGNPRNDIFFRSSLNEVRRRVKKSLGIAEMQKLVLYAPTWRDDGDSEWNDLDTQLLCRVLRVRFDGDWVCAVRMHFVLHAQRSGLMERNSTVIDVCDYPDMQELLAASDVLVSDYSSCICDFMLTRRPIFLYVPDYKQYKGKTRGLLYPLESTPCPVARTKEELRDIITEFDEEKYKRGIEDFLVRVGCVEDGCASKRVVDLIEKIVPVQR